MIACALFGACSQKSDPENAYGYVQVDFSLSDIVEDVVKSQVSDYATMPTPEDFVLTFETSMGQTYWSGTIGEWSERIKMPVGTYTLKARYGAEGEEGFGKACFAAEKSLDILQSDTLEVALAARLANCMVQVATTEMFDAYFSDYSLTLTTGAGTVIPFPKSEKRPAFIEVFRFHLAGTVTTFAGKTHEFSKTFEEDLQPATFYTLRLDADSVGGIKFLIQFNDKVETIVIEEDLNE